MEEKKEITLNPEVIKYESGEEKEVYSKEDVDSILEDYNKLKKKDFDYSKLEGKAKKIEENKNIELTEEQQKFKAVQDELERTKEERKFDYIENEMSRYIDVNDEKNREKFISEMNRINLTEEEKELPLKEQIKITCSYVNRVVSYNEDTENKNILRTSLGSGFSGARPSVGKKDFSNTEAGKSLLNKMLPKDKQVK